MCRDSCTRCQGVSAAQISRARLVISAVTSAIASSSRCATAASRARSSARSGSSKSRYVRRIPVSLQERLGTRPQAGARLAAVEPARIRERSEPGALALGVATGGEDRRRDALLPIDRASQVELCLAVADRLQGSELAREAGGEDRRR